VLDFPEFTRALAGNVERVCANRARRDPLSPRTWPRHEGLQARPRAGRRDKRGKVRARPIG